MRSEAHEGNGSGSGPSRLWGGPALNSIPVDSCRFLLILSKTSLCVSASLRENTASFAFINSSINDGRIGIVTGLPCACLFVFI